MSYILEALKKLEEKRQLDTGPHHLSTRYSFPKKQKGYFMWLYLIFIALLLNAGIFLWWAGPWQAKKSSSSGGFEISGDATANRKDKVKKDTMNEGPGTALLQTESVVEKDHQNDSRPKENGSVPLLQERPDAEKDAPGSKIIEMSELPLSIRQRLPDLSISGHFYENNPSSRIITVGGRTLHEGASAAPGVKLERITPDGAVFSCDGYRFRKSVF